MKTKKAGPARHRRKRRLHELFRKHGRKCFYCGKALNYGNCTIDHVFPRSKGGTNHPRNQVPCCLQCNSAKGSKLLQDVIERLDIRIQV